MCFIISKNNLKPKIATKEFAVYKVGVLHNRGKILESSMRSFVYEKGYEYYEDEMDIEERVIDEEGCIYPVDINVGLHAYKSRQRAADMADQYFENFVTMYVPKGATYWENETEIVTNRLIWY